jgi:ribosomal protein S12 methylthiotransferase accessory factor YcaO
VPLARERIFELHAGLVEAWRTSAQKLSVSELNGIVTFLREGAHLYESQVPVLCAQVPAVAGSRTAEGRAAIKEAVKAQAKAEALERLEQAARKLQAKANDPQHKAGRH